MTLEQFTEELDATLASMSDQELIAALEEAGCEFEDPWLTSQWNEDSYCSFECLVMSNINFDELALAA